MPTLKGHYGGTSIVLDEPATLAVGQAVEVVITDPAPPPSGRLDEPWKGKLHWFEGIDGVIEADFETPIKEKWL